MKSAKRFFLWCFLLLLFFRLETFLSPFGHDESIFAYMGQEISQGAVLYRDVTDNKPPLIFYVAAAVAKIPGPQQAYLLILDFLVALACVILFYLIIRKWTSAVFWPTAAFIVFTGAHKISQGGFLTEHYLLLFVLLAWLFWLKEKPAVWSDILSGVCFALAFFAKPVAAATVAALGIYVLFNLRRQPELFRRLLCLGAGGLVALLMVFLGLFRQGVFIAFWQDALLNLSQYQSVLSFKDFLENFILAAADNILTVGLIWFLLALACWRGEKSNLKPLFVLCLVLEFCLFAVSKRFFGHYFLQLAPALGFICALSLDEKHYVRYKYILFILLGIALVWQSYYTWRAAANFSDLLSDYRAAAYVKANTARADYISVGSDNIRIAWLANRRYFYKSPYNSENYLDSENQSVKDAFMKNKPVYLLDSLPDYANPADYKFDRRIGNYNLWCRVK